MISPDGFDPERIVEVLNHHQVKYVLVGGYAAQLYGARRPTYDIDITPATTQENLDRLSAAFSAQSAPSSDGDTAAVCEAWQLSLGGRKSLTQRSILVRLQLTSLPNWGAKGALVPTVESLQQVPRIFPASQSRRTKNQIENASCSRSTQIRGH